MAAKKRGLGKGLDALLGTSSATILSQQDGGERLSQIPVDLIRQGKYQPRKSMNPQTLNDLADSIRKQGVVQPILVRPVRSSRTDAYEIVAGERRWRAAQMAGLQEIPAMIMDIPDQAAVCIALIENIQREDLNPLEEAHALARLSKEFDLTHESIAEAVGKSRSTVTNLLRLLELHPEVQNLIQEDKLEMGHARALAGLALEKQPDIARRIVKQSLSVRGAEQLVRKIQAGRTKHGKQQKTDPNIRHLQDNLSERLGAEVQIRYSSKGSGTVLIKYNTLDELEGILKKIN